MTTLGLPPSRGAIMSFRVVNCPSQVRSSFFFYDFVCAMTRENDALSCDERECNWMVPILLSFLFLSSLVSLVSLLSRRKGLTLFIKTAVFLVLLPARMMRITTTTRHHRIWR